MNKDKEGENAEGERHEGGPSAKNGPNDEGALEDRGRQTETGG